MNKTNDSDCAVATTERARTLRPRIDVLETEAELRISAEMPGVAEDAVEVTLEGDLLSIRARACAPAPAAGEVLRREYELGDYARTLRISVDIDPSTVDATLKNGVLLVRLPKAGPEKTRIAVRAE